MLPCCHAAMLPVTQTKRPSRKLSVLLLFLPCFFLVRVLSACLPVLHVMPVFADAAGVLRLGAPPGGGGPAQPGGAAAGAGEARGIRPAPDVSWCCAFTWRAVFCALCTLLPGSRCLSLTGRKQRWVSTAPFVFGLAADSVDVRFYSSSLARVVKFSRAARKTAAGKYHVQYTGVLLCPRFRASCPLPLLRENTK